jgi:hypothetical protein
MPENGKESLRQKKKRARYIRKGKGVQKNEDGSVSTHRMGDDIEGNKSGKYHVWPTIAPDKSGKYKPQSPRSPLRRRNKQRSSQEVHGRKEKPKGKL